ncbi:MAG: flagellar biosynthetic protein FliR [Myxococcaceae bacterium]
MPGFISNIISAMTHDISQGNALVLFSLIAARMVTLVTLVPFLGSKNAPGPVKIGISLLLTLIVWPLATANLQGSIPSTLVPYLVMMMKEVFVGFALGFVTAQIFYAVEMAGQIIDVTRGANQVQLLVPELSERSSPYGDMNYQIALILFLSTGLHRIFFEGLVQSFISVPINQMPPFSAGSAAFYNEFMFLFSEIFKIAITLALPVAAVCLITNLSFGLINRIAPQINAYFLAMPATAIGGMMISFFALSMTFQQFENFSAELVAHFLRVISLLG